MNWYRNLVKPLVDLIVALTAFLILFPVFVVLTCLLFIANQGSPFFLQARPGKHGKVFRVIKFKTMNDKCGGDGRLLPDKDRLTPIGKFVRKTSLDEIPQLLNVLKGDMSLVGPRPLLVEYLDLYTPTQHRRHAVRPGITGWAQVNGRNAISWEQKFQLDVWYVDHLSWLLDLRILFKTILKVVKPEGINAEGSATIERFAGSNE
ncbi:sugar transferase [Chitinophaga silvatica]|uniref:Sugar transferase n=1 Tax=Chitinophaga silvatica TaxID=2282649 RepID=A0A3E1YA06_9BACT|nr:sugar transferase [Chitinophaga silvatica]RFS22026.1 sugar transferase [Chitinophaga silvatica]